MASAIPRILEIGFLLWSVLGIRTLLHETFHAVAKLSYRIQPAVRIPVGTNGKSQAITLTVAKIEYRLTWLGLFLDGNGVTHPWPTPETRTQSLEDIVIPLSAPIGMMLVGVAVGFVSTTLPPNYLRLGVLVVGLAWFCDGIGNTLPFGPRWMRKLGASDNVVRGNDGYDALRSARRYGAFGVAVVGLSTGLVALSALVLFAFTTGII